MSIYRKLLCSILCIVLVVNNISISEAKQSDKLSIRISTAFSPTSIKWNSWIYLKANSIIEKECYLKDKNISVTKCGKYFMDNVNPLMLIASPIKETPSYANMQYEWIPIINCNWLDVINYATLDLDTVTSETYLMSQLGSVGMETEINRKACGFYQFINPVLSGDWVCSKCGNKINDVYEFSDAIHEHTRRAFNLINGMSNDEYKYLVNDEVLVMLIGYSQQFPSLNNYSNWGTWPASWSSKETYLEWVYNLATNEKLLTKIKEDAKAESLKIIESAKVGTLRDSGLSFHIGWGGVKSRYHDLIMEAGGAAKPTGTKLDYAQHFHVESLYYYYLLQYLYTSGDLVYEDMEANSL